MRPPVFLPSEYVKIVLVEISHKQLLLADSVEKLSCTPDAVLFRGAQTLPRREIVAPMPSCEVRISEVFVFRYPTESFSTQLADSRLTTSANNHSGTRPLLARSGSYKSKLES